MEDARREINPDSPAHLDPTVECKLCQELVRLAALWLEEKAHDVVGSFKDLQSRGMMCRTHHDIISRWKAERGGYDGRRDQLNVIKNPHDTVITIQLETPTILRVIPVPGVNIDQHWPGKLLDTEWVEAGLLRTWKEKCRDVHGSSCDGPAAWRKGAPPHHLIDTWRMCIVQASSSHVYIALSYVWGLIEQFKTLKQNYDELFKEGSLLELDILNKIPRTIIDAIHIVKDMGERYIWIDAICIVQDDEESKYEEINNMASIYANAFLTIVAAQGNGADYGLRGVKGVSEPRHYVQESHYAGEHLFAHCKDLPLGRANWSTRGWTFQESLLSSRKIFFCGDRVHWQCPQAKWDEDVRPEDSVVPISPDERVSFLMRSGWPDIARYNNLVLDFGLKQLTYEEDGPAAFAGLSQVLSSQFEGGFNFGIPEMLFDLGLLWRGYPALLRRPCRRGRIPSWSWMGWIGRIDEACWQSGLKYIKSVANVMEMDTTTRQTVPLVSWYCHEPPSQSKRRIATNWPVFGSNPPSPLAAGWTPKRHPNPQEREGDWFYVHESDPTSEFWYPIPLRDPNSPPTIAPQASLISCTTQRAFLKLDDKPIGTKRPYISASEANKISLYDKSDRWAGCLDLQTGDEIKMYHDESLVPGPGDLRPFGEFVAISKGWAYNYYNEKMAEWRLDERPKTDEKYEFYNVMWIDWQDGIASRKGLARVYKEVWEAQELETIELVLG